MMSSSADSRVHAPAQPGPPAPPLGRIAYVLLALLTIAGGLVVHWHGARLGRDLQDIAGDALWAMMIAWWMGALLPAQPVRIRATLALAFCVLIEVSQRWHAPALDAVRATTLGHLVLGSGFDPRDLAAYTAGVLGAVAIEHWHRRTRTARPAH